MLDRAGVLKLVDDAYAKRAQGDKAAVTALWAPGGRYRLGGDPRLLPGFPAGDPDGAMALAALIDTFTFHSHERLDDIVEGNKAAIHWRVTLSAAGKEPVTTELYDLWTIDDNGKVASLLQFGDTALIAKLLG